MKLELLCWKSLCSLTLIEINVYTPTEGQFGVFLPIVTIMNCEYTVDVLVIILDIDTINI